MWSLKQRRSTDFNSTDSQESLRRRPLKKKKEGASVQHSVYNKKAKQQTKKKQTKLLLSRKGEIHCTRLTVTSFLDLLFPTCN